MKFYLAGTLVFVFLFAGCKKEYPVSKAEFEGEKANSFSNQKIVTSPVYRGMYISDFENICGNTQREDSLLNWCFAKNINALSLYGLGSILSSSLNYSVLAAFIKRAKNQYGIKQISAVRGNSANVTGQTSAYNSSRTDTTERFNYMQLEREWWNNACTFNDYCNNLSAIQLWGNAQTPKVKTETYIGWFKNPTGQDSLMASALLQYSNRILVHDYVTTPNFGYLQNRLDYIGRAAKALNKTAEIIVIFSASPSFSYNYFLSHTFNDAYATIVSGHNASSFAGKNNIKITGYQIFDSYAARTARP